MKKNLTFKLGLFCAALVLVATCFVTNAWAKYTKTVTATDSARVAKFAFTVTGDGTEFNDTNTINIFDTAFEHIMDDSGSDVSSAGTKLIAPGSSGEFVLVFANDSEVALDFQASAVEANTNNIPIRWSYDGFTTEHTTLDGCLYAATTANDKWQIAVGEAEKNITISWRWVYEQGNDSFDTQLGEAGTAVYNVTVKVTATQVQPQ